jgi:GWxTD domain-containing protein
MNRLFKTITAAAAAALLSSDLTAAGLSKLKGWDETPEAYFLTVEERGRWAKLTTDEEAEKFVEEYRASRGKGFAAAIQSRIEYADKNFSMGKKKGSLTLRGRTLIVLGPPARVVKGVTEGVRSKTDPTSGGDLLAGGGGGSSSGSGSVGNAHSNAGGGGADSLRGLQPVNRTEAWSWIYDESTVPPALGMKSLTLEFVVNPDEKTEQAMERAKLDQMLATVVEYWKPKK